MAFDPDYGDTHVPEEDQAALTPQAKELLGENPRKADLYYLEQQIQVQVVDDLVSQVLGGSLTLSDLLSDHFVRELHRRLYGPVWTWGGQQRKRETNIGTAPDQITVALRTSLEDLRYRWEHASNFTARALGVTAHAVLVHVHPFVDGNGRTTRVIADLVYLAAQSDDPVCGYEWDFDRVARSSPKRFKPRGVAFRWLGWAGVSHLLWLVKVDFLRCARERVIAHSDCKKSLGPRTIIL